MSTSAAICRFAEPARTPPWTTMGEHVDTASSLVPFMLAPFISD